MSEDDYNKSQDKKYKFILKLIIAIITILFGFSVLLFAVTNKGAMFGGNNNGTINIYNAPTPEEPTNNNEAANENTNLLYQKSFINMADSLIKTNDNDTIIEGALIQCLSYNSDIEFETYLGSEVATIKFGFDQSAYRLIAIFEDVGIPIEFEKNDMDFLVFSDGDFIEGVNIQISPYDFDNDTNNELIICINDGLSGLCYVFSYTKTDDKMKINGFKQELCVEMQQNVFLKNDSIIIPMGSQGLFKRYKYVEKRFVMMEGY